MSRDQTSSFDISCSIFDIQFFKAQYGFQGLLKQPTILIVGNVKATGIFLTDLSVLVREEAVETAD